MTSAKETAAKGERPAGSGMMEPQRRVWDREYASRGTKWGKRNLTLPKVLGGFRVLEVGVGNGKSLMSALDQGPEFAVAFDYSGKALEICARNALNSAALAMADAEAMPFRDCSFDAVILFYVLDNMLEGQRMGVVSESRRVLKPGGVLLFEDFALGDFRQATGKFTGQPEANTFIKAKGLICHYFAEGELGPMLSGFSSIKTGTREHLPVRGRDDLVRRLVHATAVK